MELELEKTTNKQIRPILTRMEEISKEITVFY